LDKNILDGCFDAANVIVLKLGRNTRRRKMVERADKKGSPARQPQLFPNW